MADEVTATAYHIMDGMDEDQIIAELQGQVLDTYVYSFVQDGKVVTGLSWAGVKAIAVKLADQGKAIDVDLVQSTETEDGYQVLVRASCAGLGSRLGAATQPKTMTSKGKLVADKFALQKVVSKAQRNAMRALYPETLVIEVMKIHGIGGRALPAQPRPATLNAPSSQPPVESRDELPVTPKDFLAAVNRDRAAAGHATFGESNGLFILGQVIGKQVPGFNWNALKDPAVRLRAYTVAMDHVRSSEAQPAAAVAAEKEGAP